jgi:hypothetical protein
MSMYSSVEIIGIPPFIGRDTTVPGWYTFRYRFWVIFALPVTTSTDLQ